MAAFPPPSPRRRPGGDAIEYATLGCALLILAGLAVVGVGALIWTARLMF